MKIRSASSDFRLPLFTAKGIYYFSPEQIIRLEAKSNYTNFHFIDRRPIITARVLKKYERDLEPFGFIRTHRSHLINRQHIDSVVRSKVIIMKDASRLTISKRKKRMVISALQEANGSCNK